MSKRREKRARVAIPVRIISRDSLGSPKAESACTLDVTPRGARLSGIHAAIKPGDVVRIERGKSRAAYQVCWVGQREDGRYGQLGLQCVEAAQMDWGVPLSAQADDVYIARRPSGQGPNWRAQSARHQCPGLVEVTVEGRGSHLIGELRDISALGCYVRLGFPPEPHSRVTLKIRIPEHGIQVVASGKVGASDKGFGMWVSFSEMTSDHTAALDALLRKLQAAS